MKDPADQWDSPIAAPLGPDWPTVGRTDGFFRANTAADEKIAELEALRARVGDTAVVVPEWKPIAAGLTVMVERYYALAADASQEAAITNLASLLRHASAFAGAVCTEIEHYAFEAAEARETARSLQDEVVELTEQNALMRSALANLGVKVSG